MKSIKKQKNQIRSAVGRKRRYLTAYEKVKLDNEITSRLVKLDEWKKAKNILIYVSHKYEINTLKLIKKAISDKNIIVPKTHIRFDTLSLHQIDNPDDLTEGRYSLLEPHPGTLILSPSEIDLAIIPGIAFDKKGHRIGYGKAYYDRLNKHLKCPKISLAYSFQIVDNIPAQKHDIPIDLIITENKTIHCKT
jgi:5-formyltetrahydrofolate cyclo-ligase